MVWQLRLRAPAIHCQAVENRNAKLDRVIAFANLCVKLAGVAGGCGEGLIAGVSHVEAVGGDNAAQQALREEHALALRVAQGQDVDVLHTRQIQHID